MSSFSFILLYDRISYFLGNKNLKNTLSTRRAIAEQGKLSHFGYSLKIAGLRLFLIGKSIYQNQHYFWKLILIHFVIYVTFNLLGLHSNDEWFLWSKKFNKET